MRSVPSGVLVHLVSSSNERRMISVSAPMYLNGTGVVSPH
jgi:hypothetical protein